MIVITGAAGFIGSNLYNSFHSLYDKAIILVDDFKSNNLKKNNLDKHDNTILVDRKTFIDWATYNSGNIEFIFHLGARTDTTEFNIDVLNELNLEYSKSIWELSASNNIPLIYASSAATYGSGEFGYIDDEKLIPLLKPLNPYGDSKNDFDKWVLEQDKSPSFWAGLKFFNVYGPNEYHKGRMGSVILHAFNQIQQTGYVNLFKSHNPNFEDGEQLRDFIYVKDIIKVCHFLYKNRPQSGIYNLGTGKARSFKALVEAVFKSLDKPTDIRFIDMPIDIRDKYQYFTEASMEKLQTVGFSDEFITLESGIEDYVKRYLFCSDNV